MATLLSQLTTLLRILLPIALLVLSGIAFALYAWVVPILLLATTPPRTTIRQFRETIGRGGAYLQPTSRILAFALTLTAGLTYYQADPKWVYYAVADVALVQVAWWEVVFLFPINDRVDKLEGKLGGDGDGDGTGEVRRELEGLLRRWQRWHVARFALPFFAGALGIVALV